MNMGGAPPGGLPIGFEEFSANSLADAACLNLKQQSNGYIDTGAPHWDLCQNPKYLECRNYLQSSAVD